MKNEHKKTEQDIKQIQKTDESFFKNLTGKSYREYAQYITESRGLLIDNIHKLVTDGEISEELYKKIIKVNGEHFAKNFPNSLPNTK